MFVSGCASTGAEYGDPLERVNRNILKFNLTADRYALKPAAKAYSKVPQPVRNGARNFFSHWWTPKTILNDLLQFKFAQAGRDTGRFLINTFLGAGGLMDPATEFGLPKHTEDFGQTLAVWGVPEGPYLMLPFLGPRNLRDAIDLFSPFSQADPANELDSEEATGARVLQVLETREQLLDLDEVFELQPDKYLFLREGYRQQRRQQVYDGNPPADLDDISDDDLLDELD